ncbi:MAG: hypothetical protein K0V04_15120 [Deltaproteobacteria bacterium]|nr:hypothetical protein [Deltaproteobacteria bacterium]
MTDAASVLSASIIVGGLAVFAAPVVASVLDGPSDVVAERQGIDAVLLRPRQIDAEALLDGLSLRSPGRTLAVPPWPDQPRERFGLYAVATVQLDGERMKITVVLSDGRAYYRTVRATAEGAPRLAASTIANLLAAIEEDELPPDEKDVPLPPEQEPPEQPVVETPADPPPLPEVEPEIITEPEPPLPLEVEVIGAGALGGALGPPAPSGFVGGGGVLGLELRWPSGAVASVAARSHWHRPDALVVGRTRLSVGGGYAWRRGRFSLRTVLAFDVEPWGVRRAGARERVGYPDGERRGFGLQLGGHLRVVPAYRVPLGSRLALRVGPRLEVGGSALGRAAGIARLVVADQDGGRTTVARVGGLELFGGIELGLAWSVPRRRPKAKRASGAP